MSNAFNSVGLIGRHRTAGAIDTLFTLKNFLTNRGVELVIEKETAHAMDPDLEVTTVSREELGGCCELVIVVGGDGSLLNAAHAIIEHETPILGINRGRLGFLTDIHPTELQLKVGEVLDGQYEQEDRFLLHAQVLRNGEVQTCNDALNEVVLYAGDVARMIEFEVYIDDKFVYSQRSDGLIIATPTGSTAYALSGGGPIVHPDLEAIVMVPMFPHTLTSRPIVIDSKVKIDIVVAEAIEIYPGVSCDGQAPIMLSPGDKLRVNKKDRLLKLIHPTDHNFYQILRAKLQWGTKWETSL